jgi:hypothetical protein
VLLSGWSGTCVLQEKNLRKTQKCGESDSERKALQEKAVGSGQMTQKLTGLCSKGLCKLREQMAEKPGCSLQYGQW